jgi:hypothetical protein
MKTLEKRLFHLFAPADVAKARGIVPASVACPRVARTWPTRGPPSPKATTSTKSFSSSRHIAAAA